MKKNRTNYKDRLNNIEVKNKATLNVNESEIGVTGLSISMGKVKEDVLSIIRGPKKIKVLEEMVKFDPTVGAFNNLYQSIASGVEFSIKPKMVDEKVSKKAQKQADFIESVLFEDLQHPFQEIIQNALTAPQYGFALLEPVYKIRDGEKSKFNDGYIGLKKISPRYQGSINKWIYSDNEKELIGIEQKDPNSYTEIKIPIEKLLHFKHRGINDNPEGVSLYLNCVKSYVNKKYAEDIEMIRLERGFDGFVEITAPSKYFAKNATSSEVIAMQNYFKDTIQNIRNGQNVGTAHPENVKIDIKNPGSSTTTDPNIMIERFDKDMSKSLLADFFLTQQKSGNSAGYTSSKIKIFTGLVNEMLDEICRVVNHKLIPDLIKRNLMDINLCPELTRSEILDLDLTNFMLFFQSFQKGPVPPSKELANAILKVLLGKNAPTVTDDMFNDWLLRQEVTTVSNDDGTLAGQSANSTGSKEVKKNQDVSIDKNSNNTNNEGNK